MSTTQGSPTAGSFLDQHKRGIAGAAVGGVGGFLLGAFVEVVGVSSGAVISWLTISPFIFALGGTVIGYFGSD